MSSISRKQQTERRELSRILPQPLMVTGAIAALILLVWGAGGVLVSIGSLVSRVLLPVVIGLLFSALLMPVQLFFNHLLRLPRHLAAAITTVGTIGIISGIFYMTGAQIAEGFSNIMQIISEAVSNFQTWLLNGPLQIGQEQVSEILNEVQGWLAQNSAMLSSGVLSATTSLGNIIIGILIAAVMCFFFLAEGDRMLSHGLMLVGERYRMRFREAIRRGWVTLGTWARVQVIVSAVDAIGIAIGMMIWRVEFILPLTVLTFLLCFIPMFGAWMSGFIVVLVTLAFAGPGAALFMIFWVLAVQQLESQLLSPLLMGKAVNVHPLAILLGVTTGTYVMGLTGALLTTPVLAVITSMWRYWNGRDPFPGLAAGKSALLDSPRDLMPSDKPDKMPPRVGQVTPDWVEQRYAAAKERAEAFIAKTISKDTSSD